MNEQENLTLKIHRETTSKEALDNTIYALANRMVCSVDLQEDYWVVEITPASQESSIGLHDLFLRELNDNNIRVSLDKKTFTLRERIMEKAFASITKG